jgi:SAM-dependent methyltransferase
MAPQASSQWDERYASGDAPWDVGAPDEHLSRLVGEGRLAPGRALEIGCGTGTNAVFLASRGFDVVGLDLSARAVERARGRASASGVSCAFHDLDFLRDEVPGAPYQFVFDRGCFHIFDEAEDRLCFAARVAGLLAPDGLWLSLVGSTEGPDRLEGPPRRSARDLAQAIEPALEVVELKRVGFTSSRPEPAAAWLVLSRRRAVPAQPSTRRT